MHHLNGITLTSSRLKENRTKREVRKGNLRSLNLKVILEVERDEVCRIHRAGLVLILMSTRTLGLRRHLKILEVLRYHSNLLKAEKCGGGTEIRSLFKGLVEKKLPSCLNSQYLLLLISELAE